MLVKSEKKKAYNNKVKICDKNLTKASIVRVRVKKVTVQRKYIKKNSFNKGVS